MSLVIEIYEATRCKDGRLVFTFDTDDLAPAGDLVSATVDGHAVLTLGWADGSAVRLPDVRDRLAEVVRAAAVISVRWVADGLLRGGEFRQRPQAPAAAQ